MTDSPRPLDPPADERSAEPSLEGAFSEDGVDLTQIRWMLSLTPVERLQAAQQLTALAAATRRNDS